MTMLVLWLVKYLGLDGLKTLSKGLIKWTVRLVFLILLAVLGVMLWHQLQVSGQWREYTAEFAAGVAGLWIIRQVFRWYQGRGSADVGERTIDGKVVPEKLAVAALSIPPQSPNSDYVLRGLPDYGKVLLKLSAGDFEYLPDKQERVPELAREEFAELAVNRPWLGLPRWVIAAGDLALVVAGLVLLIFNDWAIMMSNTVMAVADAVPNWAKVAGGIALIIAGVVILVRHYSQPETGKKPLGGVGRDGLNYLRNLAER